MALVAFIKSKGHQIDLLIKREEKDRFWDKVKDFKPDWVGFSAIYTLHIGDFELAREVKDKIGVKTIFGGPFATHFPKCIHREEVDVLIRGDGEEPLLEFLNACDRGEDCSQVPNAWWKKDGQVMINPIGKLEPDLNKYPIPDRSIYYKYPYLRNAPDKQFMSGRGCPFNCYFCFNVGLNEMYNLKGKNKVRRRSPELMIEELILCKKNYPMKHVTFNDDIFTFNAEWLEKFAPLYKKEVGIDFACQAHVNMLSDNVAKLLKEAGCSVVMIGLEAGNPRVRKDIMGKRFSNRQFYQFADTAHKYDMKIKCYNIVGNPTETLEEAFDTLEANAAAKIDFPWCALYQPIMGTVTYDIAIKNNCLPDESIVINHTGSVFTKSLLLQPDIERINRLHKFFYFGAKYRWTIPLIKKLVNYNLFGIYVFIFLISAFLRLKGEFKASLWNMIKFSIRNIKNYGSSLFCMGN